MAFFECEFPRKIGFSSTGGNAFSTQVNLGFSGFEQRNRNWAQSRGKWQLILTSRPQSEFQLVYNFFLNVGGMADAFRLFWPLDSSGVGQFIGTGDGANTTFQLQKTYTVAGRSYVRTIKKPIMSTVKDFTGAFLTNTVVIYDNGTKRLLTVDYTVDATTGIVTFTVPPANGHIITADFQFHFPVRFDIDDMTSAAVDPSDVLDGNGLVTWSGVNLVEVRI